MTIKDLNNTAVENVKEYILSEIEQYEGNCIADLHHELFNTDYWVIGTYEAKKELESYDLFHCIGIVQEYEKEQFGESLTEIGDPEKLLNMYIYIVGETLLFDLDTIQDNWSDYLTKEMINEAIEELQ